MRGHRRAAAEIRRADARLRSDREGYRVAVKPRTLGLEEEFLIVDPATREISPRSQRVLRRTRAAGPVADEDIYKELCRHQLETRTPAAVDLGELRTHLVR